MNNLFRNKIKDIFNTHHKIYSNVKYNKNNKNDLKKQTYIPKIIIPKNYKKKKSK